MFDSFGCESHSLAYSLNIPRVLLFPLLSLSRPLARALSLSLSHTLTRTLNAGRVGCASFLAVKDKTEITCMKKAALVTKSLLKGVFLKTMQDVIENDDGTEATQKTHSALSNEVDAYLIETPSKIPKVGKKLSEADKEALDSCFAPIIQRSVEKYIYRDF